MNWNAEGLSLLERTNYADGVTLDDCENSGGAFDYVTKIGFFNEDCLPYWYIGHTPGPDTYERYQCEGSTSVFHTFYKDINCNGDNPGNVTWSNGCYEWEEGGRVYNNLVRGCQSQSKSTGIQLIFVNFINF